MNDINQKPKKYHNRFIVPVFSMAFFIIITMTISYGHFVSSSSSSQTEFANTSFPGRCKLTTTTNSATMSITRAQLKQQANPTASWTNTVTSSVTLTGPTTCSCTYYVKLYQESGSDTYAPTTTAGLNEFTYKVEYAIATADSNNSASGTTERNYNLCPGEGTVQSGCIVGNGVIVPPDNIHPQVHSWTVTSKFYNISNYNQIQLQGKTFKYSFRFIINACTFE